MAALPSSASPRGALPRAGGGIERRAGGGHVLLAGGGTGGHVFPALAVAAELAQRGWAVSLAGGKSGLEERLAKEQGVAFHALPARPLLGKGRVAQALALATLGRSALAARRLIRRLDARVVIGTGGYVSAPAILGARLAGRPVLLLEINARAGTANRWFSRYADAALLAYGETARELACPSEVTGTPVRPAFFEVPPLSSSAAAAKRPPHLLVLGGSQGARQLNELVPVALAVVARASLARGVEGLEITHQCGRAHLEAAQAAYVAADVESAFVRVTPFLEDVAGAMAAADLVICRAGAMTVAEVAAAGRPAVFIPLAVAAGHQLDNARELVEAGADRLLPPAEASNERLAAMVAELLADRAALAAMGEAARRLARPDAAARIADQAELWASGRRGASGERGASGGPNARGKGQAAGGRP